MFLNLALRKKSRLQLSIVPKVSIEQMKKSNKSSNQLFFSTFSATFLKTEKICSSDIMGQNWYSYNAKFTNPNCLVKNSYNILLGIHFAKGIEKFWSADKWNYELSMQSVQMHCVSLSIYLSIHPFIYLHIFI